MPARDESQSRIRLALTALMKWLRTSRVEGAVIGGIAVGLLAEPRVTRDIDAVLWLDFEACPAFLAAGRKLGFVPRFADILDFARNSRLLPMTHRPTRVDIDLALGELPFEREVLDRAVTLRVGRTNVKLATPDDLIVMKLIARRPRDLADVENLLNYHPAIDLKRIRRWVTTYAELLEQPEVVDEMDRQLSLWKQSRQR